MPEMKIFLALIPLICAALPAQETPAPTGLPGQPFSIQKTWIVGGVGNWGNLTLDPVARRLFIAHGPAVQVVDMETGSLAGTIPGIRLARSIALDDQGEFGYVADGPAGQVKVFDRTTLKLVAAIPTGPGPRSIVLDPVSGLLLAICAAPDAEQPAASAQRPAPHRPVPSTARSMISVVDLQSRKTLANILVAGKLGFAQDDGGGHVFIAVQDRNEIALFDTQLVSSMLQTMRGQSTSPNSSGPDSPLLLDWSASIHPSTEGRLRFFRLGQQCPAPTALAADSRHLRLFVACGNFTLAVLNADTGALVTSLPTGPGADALGYDAARGLIFVPNGGGWGRSPSSARMLRTPTPWFRICPPASVPEPWPSIQTQVWFIW